MPLYLVKEMTDLVGHPARHGDRVLSGLQPRGSLISRGSFFLTFLIRILKNQFIFVRQNEESRIIYIRFCSKSAVLLHRIKNQNIEAKMKSRSWKPLAIYREKPEAYTEGAVWKAPPFWKNGEKKCHRIASRCWNIASIKVRESAKNGCLKVHVIVK